MDKIEALKEMIDSSNGKVVFFGGAGVSTASNIPDFRSSNGIYSESYGTIPIEQIISHTFFMKHPDIFYEVYKNKLCFPNAKPNYCHKTLSELEKRGLLSSVITQNIDNLHQMAGSKRVIELHGSVYRNYCMKCRKPYTLEYVLNSKGIPMCDCGGMVKPDVVLYEESLDYNSITNALNEISNANTLIIGGTSLSVYPAAGFIDYFRGENLVIINKSSTIRDREANLLINDDISEVFRKLMELYDWFY